jgi:hypothetical protein
MEEIQTRHMHMFLPKNSIKPFLFFDKIKGNLIIWYVIKLKWINQIKCQWYIVCKS